MKFHKTAPKEAKIFAVIKSKDKLEEKKYRRNKFIISPTKLTQNTKNISLDLVNLISEINKNFIPKK